MRDGLYLKRISEETYRVARAICQADDCNPDRIAIGFGYIMPKGEKYYLWETRVGQAEAAIEAKG